MRLDPQLEMVQAMRYVDIFFRAKYDIEQHPRVDNAVQAIYEFEINGHNVYHALVSLRQYNRLRSRFPAALHTFGELVAKLPAAANILHHFAGRPYLLDPVTRRRHRLTGEVEDIDEDPPGEPTHPARRLAR